MMAETSHPESLCLLVILPAWRRHCPPYWSIKCLCCNGRRNLACANPHLYPRAVRNAAGRSSLRWWPPDFRPKEGWGEKLGRSEDLTNYKVTTEMEELAKRLAAEAGMPPEWLLGPNRTTQPMKLIEGTATVVKQENDNGNE
jgi:hypothetical protein